MLWPPWLLVAARILLEHFGSGKRQESPGGVPSAGDSPGGSPAPRPKTQTKGGASMA
jgi:hypothetical protein